MGVKFSSRRIRRAAGIAARIVPQHSAFRSVVHAALFVLAALTMSDALLAQTPELFQFQPALLVCVLPPPSPTPPGPWPVAATDSLVGVAGAPVTFTRAALLANDAGTSLVVTGVGPTSTAGGTLSWMRRCVTVWPICRASDG